MCLFFGKGGLKDEEEAERYATNESKWKQMRA